MGECERRYTMHCLVLRVTLDRRGSPSFDWPGKEATLFIGHGALPFLGLSPQWMKEMIVMMEPFST